MGSQLKARQAHRAGPAQARGRHHLCHQRRHRRGLQRATTSASTTCTSSSPRKKIQAGTDPAAMAHNMTLLDEGTLYVAKLTSDIPGRRDRRLRASCRRRRLRRLGNLDPAAALRTQRSGRIARRRDDRRRRRAVFTRLAADKAGATKMDRPEDFEANPNTGKVYVALTNNDRPRRARQGRGRRGQPAQRQQERTDPGDHRRPRGRRASPGSCCWSAAIPRRPTPTSPDSTRRRSARSPARTTWRSTATATCGSPPTATRWAPTTACSPSRSRGRTAVRPSSS